MNAFAAANATAPKIYPIGILQAGETGYPTVPDALGANVTARGQFAGGTHYAKIKALFADRWHARLADYWQTRLGIIEPSHYLPHGEPLLESLPPNMVFLPHFAHGETQQENVPNAVIARMWTEVLAQEMTTPYHIAIAQHVDQLASYTRYETKNWDGFDADPITTETRTAAKDFLESLPKVLSDPAIAPGADGAIALEWIWKSGNLHKLFIDIGPGKVWKGYWRRADGQRGVLGAQDIESRNLKFDLARLVRRLNR